jgi:dynein heavy chain
MFGPGLLSGCAVNEDVSFIIQARDDNGNNRTTGGDQFMISIMFLEGGPEGEDVPVNNVHIKDNQQGQYMITYIAPHAGRYEVKVQFMGTFGGQSGQVKGSDVIITFDEDAPRDNNLMAGELVMKKLQGDIMSLQKLTKELTAGIFVRVKEDSWSTEEHIRVLVKVKENLIRMEDETTETNLLVVRCEAIIDFLNEQAVDLNRLDEHLGTGKLAWEKILREAPQVQAKISPMMRSHSSKIRTDIAGYEKHAEGYKERTMEADFYKFATGPRRAKELINEADEVQKQEETVCHAMNHIADIFECTREMQTSREIVDEVGDLLRDFRVLWDCNENVVETIDNAKQTTWQDLNSDEFEDAARGLVQSVRRLPKSVRMSDAFRGLDRVAKEFLSTCPLITSLRSPAMRERHWRELMEVVKREFPLPAENPDMLLKDLLELELHKVSVDVEEITDKALKEGRHEETLKNLEIVWSSIQFSMSWYKDTDVPLLKLQDESVDQLESDQMSVQSIVSSRYAFFKKEAATWQQDLSDISKSFNF